MDHIANLRRMGLFDARVPRYTSYPPATAFSAGVGADFQRDSLAALDPAVPVSVYLHIPFCERLCWFCACATQGTSTLKPVENYIGVVKAELALLAQQLPAGIRMGQMHWGGGTPTILPPALIRDLAQAVMDVIPPAEDFSFSVEIDPTLVDDAKSKKRVKNSIERRFKCLNTCSNIEVATFDFLRKSNIDNIDDYSKSLRNTINKCIKNSWNGTLSELLEKSIPGYNHDSESFQRLWNYIPQTSVYRRCGKGELFFIFMFEGSIPERGDIRIGKYDIEIKGNGGRLHRTSVNIDDHFFPQYDPLTKCNEELITDYCNLIVKKSHTIENLEQCRDLFKNIPKILNKVRDEHIYFNKTGKTKKLSMFMYICGLSQLLSYCKVQKFNCFLAFNKNYDGIYMQFLNMDKCDSITKIYKQIKNSSSVFRFSQRTDGMGYSLTVHPELALETRSTR